jgi:CheY-like chemotaxis protein
LWTQAADQADVAARRHRETRHADCGQFRGGRVKILIVEDEAHPPDVVITDRRMPGVDGVELCRRVRAAAWSTCTPSIFRTGLMDRDQPRGV